MFEEYVQDNFESDFKVIGRYVDNNTNIRMYHSLCGNEFDIRPSNFKTRKRCPICYGNPRKTTEIFIKEMKNLRGNSYELIDDYVNSKTKVKLLHKKCGNIWEVTPDDFLNGKNECRYCSTSYQSTEKFSRYVEDISKGKIILIAEYKNKSTPLKFHCIKCDKEFYRQPQHFKAGCHCSYCGLKARSGKNHYRYNNELTEEDREHRDMFSGEIKRWRSEVYTREHYTCRVCEKVGAKLNAHHLNSWDIDKENRFNLDNGVTLCVECHKNFHKNFGYGKNTKKQFEQYLKRF